MGACLVNTEGVGELGRVVDIAAAFPGFAIPCAGVHPVQYERQGEELVGRSANLSDLQVTLPLWRLERPKTES